MEKIYLRARFMLVHSFWCVTEERKCARMLWLRLYNTQLALALVFIAVVMHFFAFKYLHTEKGRKSKQEEKRKSMKKKRFNCRVTCTRNFFIFFSLCLSALAFAAVFVHAMKWQRMQIPKSSSAREEESYRCHTATSMKLMLFAAAAIVALKSIWQQREPSNVIATTTLFACMMIEYCHQRHSVCHTLDDELNNLLSSFVTHTLIRSIRFDVSLFFISGSERGNASTIFRSNIT